MNWTKQQRDAIEHEGGDVLVAAGAGAGKTGVLTERVVRKVVQLGWSVADMLVVTFTDAAAAEMRRRIARKLTDAAMAARASADPAAVRRLDRQVVLLDAGQVCTLHSFAAALLREHFNHLGLDPSFEIIDPDEAKLLRQEVLADVLETRYKSTGPQRDAFEKLLLWRGSAGGDGWLRDAIVQLNERVAALRDPEHWWREALSSLDVTGQRKKAGASLDSSPWRQAISRLFELEFDAVAARLDQAMAMAAAPAAGGLAAYLPPIQTLTEYLADLRARLDKPAFWSELDRRLTNYPIKRMVAVPNDVPGKNRLKKLLDDTKKALAELRELTARSEQDLLADLAGVAPHAATLAELCREYRDAYAAAKRARGQLDFNDLERLALRLLSEHVDVRRQVASQFREILVDEYQDISPVQDAILRAAAGRDPDDRTPHAQPAVPLFMVGDLKQSIYRFRLAEPDIFAEMLDAFSRNPRSPQPKTRSLLVHLADNFRSRRTIIDSVNAVFARLMVPMRTLTGQAGGPVYGDGARLNFAAAAYRRDDSPPDCPVELHLLDWSGDLPETSTDMPADTDESSEAAESADANAEQLERLRVQARLVGRRIHQLLGRDGTPPATVWDDAASRWRAARPRDFVVLLRTVSAVATRFAEELTAIGLPVHASQPGGYFGAVEVADMRTLLTVLDNPRQDIPLAAVLRSPLMSFAGGPLTVDELATIRLACPEGQFWDAVAACGPRPSTGEVSASAHGDGDPATNQPPEAERQETSALLPRLRIFLDKIAEWRTMARRRPISELLADIFRVTGYLDYVPGLRSGPQRRANLLHLAHRARQFDRFARQGLARFVRFLDELDNAGEDLGTPSPLTEADDVIRVQTIHSAKGLEFPIVIMADIEHQFNMSDCGQDVLFHRQLLMGLRCLDADRRIRFGSLPHMIIGSQIRLEMLMEELRLQYVAMTRARDRLIMFGSRKKLLPALLGPWSQPLQASDITQARCPLDWLAPAILAEGAGKEVAVRLADAESLPDQPIHVDGQRFCIDIYSDAFGRGLNGDYSGPADAEDSKRDPADEQTSQDESEPPFVEQALARLTFSYPHPRLDREPAKRSVSELKHLFDSRAEDDETLPDMSSDVQTRNVESGDYPEPQTEVTPPWELPQQSDGRARGLATHAVLQRLDLAAELDDPQQVRAQIELMREQGLLDPHQPGLVDADAVAAFFASELGRSMLAQPGRVRREWAFSLAVPLGQVDPALPASVDSRANGPQAKLDERVLVQGIIDVLMENDDGTLTVLDFKTDRLRGRKQAQARAQDYRFQLDWYARAAEAILGKRVSRRAICFIAAGQTVDV